MTRFDVAICGAGPAGAACALSLKAFAPDLSSCLIDAGGPTGQPVGEALPPLARPMLEHLGLWDAFQRSGPVDVFRSQSVWGGPVPGGVEFMDYPLAQGWTLDRPGFNALIEGAARKVVDLRIADQVAGLDRDAGGWRVTLRDRAEVFKARVIVDATGRRAAICRLLDVRPRRMDRMVALVAHAAARKADEPGVLVETRPDGWWYTSAVPGGRRVAAFLTDSDLVRSGGFDDRLSETRAIAAVTGAMGAPERVVPAASQITPALPDGVLAVGDAAACFDPISSCGILRALRSGIFASYAIRDGLGSAGAQAYARYNGFLAAEWAWYRKTWSHYYRQETRWPDQPFWSRRQSVAQAA